MTLGALTGFDQASLDYVHAYLNDPKCDKTFPGRWSQRQCLEHALKRCVVVDPHTNLPRMVRALVTTSGVDCDPKVVIKRPEDWVRNTLRNYGWFSVLITSDNQYCGQDCAHLRQIDKGYSCAMSNTWGDANIDLAEEGTQPLRSGRCRFLTESDDQS